MSFLVPTVVGPLAVAFASEISEPLFRRIATQTGLFIGNRLASMFGPRSAMDTTNIIKSEMLNYGISIAGAGALFSSVGREIFNSYKTMQKKQVGNSGNAAVIYSMIGFLTFILHWVGIREVQEYIQNNEKLLAEKDGAKYHDALNLLSEIKNHDENTEGNHTLYNFIIDSLYKNEEYYSKMKGLNIFNSKTYATPNVVRIIFNILVGLSTQINYLFGNESNDGVKSFKWFSLLMYFEALAITLRVPSIAPLYNLIFKNINIDYLIKTKKRIKK